MKILTWNRGWPVADLAPASHRQVGGLATGTRGGMVADSMPLTCFSVADRSMNPRAESLNQNKRLTAITRWLVALQAPFRRYAPMVYALF